MVIININHDTPVLYKMLILDNELFELYKVNLRHQPYGKLRIST